MLEKEINKMDPNETLTLLENLDLYQYFENNYICTGRQYMICYPPNFHIPLCAKNKDLLFEKVLDIANDMRENMRQEELDQQLQDTLEDSKI